MKPKVKFVLLTFLKSLISNDAAIDGAKQAPWWMALILGLVSVGLPLIPTAVNTANTKGSQYLSNYSAGHELALTSILKEADQKGYELRISNGTCNLYKDNSQIVGSDSALFTYESERHEIKTVDDTKIQEETTTKEVEMLFFYTDTDDINTYIKNIESKYSYVAGKATPTPKEGYEPAEGEEVSYYIPSCVVFYQQGLYIALTQQGTSNVFGNTTFISDWTHTADCDLIDRLLKVEDIEETKQVVTNRAYVDGVYSNLKGVVDETYQTAKGQTLLRSTLIFLGVYVVLVLLMGLMLFLLTRGKNNPFNYLNFGVTLKMACWAAFTPAVLGMALGFWLTQFAPYIFIALIGIRVMWMSLRSLRPYQ